jgi:hypothetical protein
VLFRSFYLGKVGTGILKLITFGGFGLWTLIDLVIIMGGTMKDKQGREMLQVAEYKKFSHRVVLWFAVILGLFILINGVLLILGAFYVVSGVMDGSLGLPPIPGLPSQELINGDPEAFQSYGL